MIMFFRLSEKLRAMAKRKKTMGKSSRRGNSPSPYQKYAKKPHRYSPGYYDWKRSMVARVGKSTNKYATEAQSQHRA